MDYNMRYIGNKTRLLDKIDTLLKDKNINHGVFADLFTGTGSVADYFKDKFTIIANDIENYASLFAYAKINNKCTPEFKKFKDKYSCSPFEYFNDIDTKNINDYGFITKEYSPIGKRKFFSIDNAKKIDFIRSELNKLKAKQIIDTNEFVFLLASLVESTMNVSNTSGTYEAFFKDWEPRSKKSFKFLPLNIENKCVNSSENKVYVSDANYLARKIHGDVAYIDTPYTVTQYASAYHLLETLVLNDSPNLIGKTGRRENRVMSNYSKRNKVYDEFNDLFRQLNFKHIIVSYSNQSLVSLNDLVSLIEKYAVQGTIDIRQINFKEYSNLNKSKKQNGSSLKEVLIYFEKDVNVKKSPLNYAGSKDTVVKKIISNLPTKISTFVDCMSGACNVGINIRGVNKIVFNEKQLLVSKLMKYLLTENTDVIIDNLSSIISEFDLKKGDKNSYIKLRNEFNSKIYEKKDISKFFILTLYSFQHMIRFNSKGDYNVPVGNSYLTNDVIDRIKKLNDIEKNFEFINGNYLQLNLDDYDKDSLFYFDPPYIVTSASYNDGNRMNIKWDKDDEIELLNYLSMLNNKGYKFILSNVISHKDKINQELVQWIKENNLKKIDIGKTGRRFPRTEVLVKNFD